MSRPETQPGSGDAAAILDANRTTLLQLRPWAWRRIHDGLPAAPRPRPVRGGVYRAIAQEAGVGRAREVVVFGFGAGDLLEAVLAQLPAGGRATCAVIDPGALLVALASRDLSALLSDSRLTLALGDLREIAAALPEAGESLVVLIDEPSIRAASPALRPLVEMGQELAAAARSARHQRVYALDNLRRNLPAILAAPHAGVLRSVFGGQPVVLVAPGPSLEGDLAELAHAERPLLVALDTALRPLTAAGIHADLAVTLDPTPSNLAKFAAQDPEQPLVFFGSARPEAIEAARCRFFALEAGDLLDQSDAWFGREGRVATNGSVLLAALELLLAWGAETIALVGVDLALDGARTHAALPDGSGAHSLDPSVPLRMVEARGGGVVATTESLWRHRRRLLRRLDLLAPGRVIDATRRGAALPGVTRQLLGELLPRWRRAYPQCFVPGAAHRQRCQRCHEVVDVAARERAAQAALDGLLAAARQWAEGCPAVASAPR